MQTEATVQSVVRTFSLLQVLARTPGASLSAISQAANLHPATTRRLLQTLESLGYVYQAGTTRRYYLGPALMHLGRSAAMQFPFREAARAEMEELVARCHETAYIAVLQDGDVFYVEVVESSQTIRMSTAVGDRCPAYSTATGRILLAGIAPPHRDRYLEGLFAKQTPFTVTDPQVLRYLIDQAREAGVSIVVDEQEVGVTSVAAPICDISGRTIAALAIAGPTYRMRERTGEFADFATAWGHRISRTIIPPLSNATDTTPFQ